MCSASVRKREGSSRPRNRDDPSSKAAKVLSTNSIPCIMTAGLTEIKILSIHLFEGFPRAFFLLCMPGVHAFQSNGISGIIPTEVNPSVTVQMFFWSASISRTVRRFMSEGEPWERN